jgi:hypothetical protein
MCKTQCLLRYGWFSGYLYNRCSEWFRLSLQQMFWVVQVISTTDALSGSGYLYNRCSEWFPCMSTQIFSSSSHERSALFKKFLVLFKSPSGYSLLTAVTSLNYWVCLNTPKPFGVPTAKNSGDHAGQLIGSLYSICCQLKVWSRCSLTMQGHLKTLMSSAPGCRTVVLQKWVEKTCQDIRVKLGIF